MHSGQQKAQHPSARQAHRQIAQHKDVRQTAPPSHRGLPLVRQLMKPIAHERLLKIRRPHGRGLARGRAGLPASCPAGDCPKKNKPAWCPCCAVQHGFTSTVSISSARQAAWECDDQAMYRDKRSRIPRPTLHRNQKREHPALTPSALEWFLTCIFCASFQQPGQALAQAVPYRSHAIGRLIEQLVVQACKAL